MTNLTSASKPLLLLHTIQRLLPLIPSHQLHSVHLLLPSLLNQLYYIRLLLSPLKQLYSVKCLLFFLNQLHSVQRLLFFFLWTSCFLQNVSSSLASKPAALRTVSPPPSKSAAFCITSPLPQNRLYCVQCLLFLSYLNQLHSVHFFLLSLLNQLHSVQCLLLLNLLNQLYTVQRLFLLLLNQLYSIQRLLLVSLLNTAVPCTTPSSPP